MPAKHALIPLFAIALFGLVLRAYNLNFPSIGYHSMKENEALSMAQEMLRTKDFTSKSVYFYNAFAGAPEEKAAPQPPLVPYQIILSWKLFGENLWGPRFFNILFGLLGIFAAYFITRRLLDNAYSALFASYILAAMPLAVFFSRNLQPESPAFFFMLSGTLFCLRFFNTLKKYNLFLSGAAFALAWLYKPNFLIGAVPLILCAPFAELYAKRKAAVKYAASAALGFVFAALVVFKLSGADLAGILRFGPWNLLEAFKPSYWAKNGKMIWWYANKENFTIVFVSLALAGLLTAVFRKSGGLVRRFIIGWALCLAPYVVIYSESIYQQSDLQMPFLLFVCVSSAYALLSASEAMKKFIKAGIILPLILLAAGASAPFMYKSLVRMHTTVFLGMDVAGESLKGLTKPEEKVFLLTHAQGRGIARYARRYTGWPQGLEDFKDKESRFDVRYLCIYPLEFSTALKAGDPELFEHIRKNYHVKEAGLREDPRQVLYVILEKGAGSDPETFLNSFSGPLRLRTIYRMFGSYVFFYTLSPAPQ